MAKKPAAKGKGRRPIDLLGKQAEVSKRRAEAQNRRDLEKERLEAEPTELPDPPPAGLGGDADAEPIDPTAAASSPWDDSYTKYRLPDGPDSTAFGDLPASDTLTADQLLKEQLEWVRRTGETPLEFLVRCYRHVWLEPELRVSAAKAALDFIHKRMPRNEIVGNDPNNPLPGTERDAKDKLRKRIAGLARGTAGPAQAGKAEPRPRATKPRGN